MAEHILISVHNGGTGTSVWTGIKGAGKKRLGTVCRVPSRVKWKGGAQILISVHNGGTGASFWTGIKGAGKERSGQDVGAGGLRG
jgi:glutamate synthase domain-containing protein 2